MTASSKTLLSRLKGFSLKIRRRIFQRMELCIMDRDLSLPDPVAPQGRVSPAGESSQEDFDMPLVTHQEVDHMAAYFSPSKLKVLHRRIDDPTIEFRRAQGLMEDGSCFGFLMHATAPFHEELYNYTVDPGKFGVYQFDGWVSPHARGKLVAIRGMIFMANRRRQEGYQHIRVIVWPNDIRSLRLHKRFGFQEVRRIIYTRLGPFRWTRPLPVPSFG